jgi:hypothetical protein
MIYRDKAFPGLRFWSILLAQLVVAHSLYAQAQEAGLAALNIVIVEGEGAINNARQRVAREPIVQVQDENRKPVAGATVTFFLPNQGASGVFANGAKSLTVLTDSNGQAVARGLRVNNVAGNYQIRVSASYQGRTASTVIHQEIAPAAATVGAAGVSVKLIAILVAAGAAAAAGGAIAATRGGGGNNGTGQNGGAGGPGQGVLNPGTPVVGPPR